MVCLQKKGLGKVHEIGDNAVVGVRQKEVNSKLLLVLDFLAFCALVSLIWLKRVVLE